jgi:hypothetical protein
MATVSVPTIGLLGKLQQTPVPALPAVTGLVRPGDHLTDESGNRLTDESGNELIG